MARIDRDTIDAVRRAGDLVELVGGAVQLVRRGGRWWGCCPFHEERTPSFSLIPPENQTYHCFGCGASGDAFTWMQEREGAGSFQEAVEALADRFGVPLNYVEEDATARQAREGADRRTALLDRAAEFYVSCLWGMDEAAPARDYLRGRGFPEELLRAFRVGYAPASGSALTRRARAQGVAHAEMEAVGLARSQRSGAGDFFSARIMFPISDARGRVQGFGGRVMPGAEGAKYINSPESDRFRKRTLVFGLAQARAAAAKRRWMCVVEGYTDVLAMAAADVPATVACMGTSLTSEQLAEIARVADEVRLCFDGDAAGEAAAERSSESAGIGGRQGTRRSPLRLSALSLPSGTDPGDMIAQPGGAMRLRALAESPEPLIVRLVRSRASRALTDPRDRDAAFNDIERRLGWFPESVERGEAARLAISLLQLPPSLAARLLAPPRDRSRGVTPAARMPADRLGGDAALQSRILALALALPQIAAAELASLPSETFDDPAQRALARLIVAGSAPGDEPELAPVVASLSAQLQSAATVEELREAVLRRQERILERRIAQLRDGGRMDALMSTQDLLRRVRDALRRGPDDPPGSY